MNFGNSSKYKGLANPQLIFNIHHSQIFCNWWLFFCPEIRITSKDSSPSDVILNKRIIWMLTKLHFEQSLIKVCRTALKNFSGLQIENLWASYKGGSVMDNLRNIHFNLNTNMYKYKHEYKYNRDPENGRWWAQSLYNKFVMGLLSWFNILTLIH